MLNFGNNCWKGDEISNNHDITDFYYTLNMLLHYHVKCKNSDGVAGSVCESAALLKDKELSYSIIIE